MTTKYHIRKVLRLVTGVILFLLWSNDSFSQYYDEFRKLWDSKGSLESRMAKVDSLILSLEKTNYASLGEIYADYAYFLNEDHQLTEKPILLTKKALKALLKQKNLDTPYYQQTAQDLAIYHKARGEVSESIDAYQIVLTVNDSSFAAIQSYFFLAEGFTQLNDYYRAFEYYELAIARLSGLGKQQDFLRDALQNIVKICFLLNTESSFKKGRKYALAADSLASIIPTPPSNAFGIKINLAILYQEEGFFDYETSLGYFQQALSIAEKISDTSRVKRVYQGLGDLYTYKDPQKALQFYDTAIAMTSKADTAKLGDLYFSKGHTLSLLGMLEESLEWRHKGLKTATSNSFLSVKDIDQNFLFSYTRKSVLQFYLIQLAETYLKYHHDTGNIEYLQQSIAYFKMADYLIDLIKINSSDFDSRLYWRAKSTELYGKAIKACYLVNDPEDAFYFMEKNKALLLQEDIARERLKQSTQVPQRILEEEKLQRRELIRLKALMTDKVKLSTVTLDSIRSRKSMVEASLAALQGRMKLRKFIQEPIISTLSEVQKTLNPDEIMVEYHISIDDGFGIYSNKENGYAIFITNNDFFFFEIEGLSSLKKKIGSLIGSLQKPFQKQEDLAVYSGLSNEIFEQLFPNPTIRSLVQDKTLTVVPDAYLSFIPFEALNVSGSSLKYLIEETEVTYLYSHSFSKVTKDRSPEKVRTLTISPIQFATSQLEPLPGSRDEVDLVMHHYPGEKILQEQASKQAFLDNMNNFDLIHIATHADATATNSPWIAMYDEKIVLEELYLTQNQASLVVLSGCNTSLGKEEIGEGVMSLARGFFYGGSSSVISSLWNVDDQSAPFIVGAFYENLKEGHTKSRALHLAKKSYLRAHNLSEKSPHFWASLILIGENDRLKSSQDGIIWYLFTALTALSIVFLIIWKSTQNKKLKIYFSKK